MVDDVVVINVWIGRSSVGRFNNNWSNVISIRVVDRAADDLYIVERNRAVVVYVIRFRWVVQRTCVEHVARVQSFDQRSATKEPGRLSLGPFTLAWNTKTKLRFDVVCQMIAKPKKN